MNKVLHIITTAFLVFALGYQLITIKNLMEVCENLISTDESLLSLAASHEKRIDNLEGWNED